MARSCRTHQIKLVGAERGQAVRRVGEFHQLHVQAFSLEEPFFLGNEEFGMPRHGQMADLESNKFALRLGFGNGR